MSVEQYSPAMVHEQQEFSLLLDEIRGIQDPNAQFNCFVRSEEAFCSKDVYLPERCSAEEFDALVGFAGDPEASVSLLVRAKALDYAIDGLHIALREDPGNADLQRRRDEIQEIIPYAFDWPVIYDATKYSGSRASGGAPLAWYTPWLMQAEGIREGVVYPDWHQISWDPSEMPNLNPVRAFMLLEHLVDMERAGEVLHVNRYTGLAALALDIHRKVVPDEDRMAEQVQYDTESRARLSRLIEHGDDHTNQIKEFLSTNDPEITAYAKLLNEVYDAASILHEAFPVGYTPAIRQGAPDMVASCIFAVRQHIANGKVTHVKLPLNDQEEVLPLRLKDDEPVQLLTALRDAMRIINYLTPMKQAAAGRNADVVAVTQYANFMLYRLLGKSTPVQGSLYVRPRGGYAFDRDLEYGRLTEGVEGSIGYVTDPLLSNDRLLRVGKSRGWEEDSRISIRVDREGQREPGTRDPASRHGRLSLDIGSVLGKDNWLSTKVGRFIAWGNYLRSKARGEATSLNHAKGNFSDEQGDADSFALEALSMVVTLESQKLSADGLRKRELSLGRIVLD